MTPFAYAAAATVEGATRRVARTPGAEFIAGGTDMVQLLQEGVRRPSELVDVNALPLGDIEMTPAYARIGALCRMADVAADPRIRREFPVVAEALLASASPQVRNMATIGGNLLQRTRCLYFRDVATPCNKREPGSGCPAQDGQNRMNALLGGSAHCIATYPGDLAVALAALDAWVEVADGDGPRMIPVTELHRPPGDTPSIETVLGPGELIVAVRIPTSPFARRSHYLKVRDRTSFEFALVSAAVALEIEDGAFTQVRVGVGGVATKPWRLLQVEQMLVGRRAHPDVFRAAAARAAEGAEPRAGNAFKVRLLERTVERALQIVSALP
jgi:xanthine dehydrogenase YagS FAD-binding subunit